MDMLVEKVDLAVAAEVIDLLRAEEMALVIHSQAHPELHLLTDGVIMVELLRTQEVAVAVAVQVEQVLMALMALVGTVE